jgi:hypothetical protein
MFVILMHILPVLLPDCEFSSPGFFELMQNQYIKKRGVLVQTLIMRLTEPALGILSLCDKYVENTKCLSESARASYLSM